MKLSITGVNHRTAPVEVREKLAFPEGELPEALRLLREGSGVQEALILSTCNRVEVAVMAEDSAAIVDFLANYRHMDPKWLEPYLYHYRGDEALRHLFRVAASLDSMVVGEPQILGQLKAAFQVAKDSGCLSGPLENVLARAFSAAKRVRTETEIGSSAVSVSYAAVELAREIFGSLKGRRVLLIGAGKMSELAARHLKRSGATDILVTNRTRSRAEEMAVLFGGRVIEYDSFLAVMPDVDIIITSSGAPNYILHPAEMKRVIDLRRNRPMFLIDIAVPRNIDPAINKLDNVFLYDIDDLQRVVETNVSVRKLEAEQAEQIVTEEVERTISSLRLREVGPTIAGLQDQLEQLRLAEIERMRGKFGALTPQQEEALDALTKGIMNKVAHAHIVELRRDAGKPGGGQVVSAIRKVFRLGDSAS
jgi:glutamyl-tRNA reductase